VAQGAVTPAKNQGKCQAGYAFAAVGAAEGIYKIKAGPLLDLSAQQMVDCTSSSNHGCSGGTIINVFYYMLVSGIYSAIQASTLQIPIPT